MFGESNIAKYGFQFCAADSTHIGRLLVLVTLLAVDLRRVEHVMYEHDAAHLLHAAKQLLDGSLRRAWPVCRHWHLRRLPTTRRTGLPSS